MTDKQLAEIEQRERMARKGPWYFRPGVHSGPREIRDAGGLHTRTEYEIECRDGIKRLNDNILFPAVAFAGRESAKRKIAMMAQLGHLDYHMELIGDPNDLSFIEHSREDIPALTKEVRRLREVLEGIRQIADEDIREGKAEHNCIYQIEADARAALGS
jgi:hypothetical protein